MRNQFGLDADYFKGKLRRTLDDIDHYTPGEMARTLVRLARTADEAVAIAEMAVSGTQKGNEMHSAYIKANPISSWNTGATYSEHGQRIAAIELPDGKAYFCDVDRNIDGVTTMRVTTMYQYLREFVTMAYMFGHYTAGTHEISQYADWGWEGASALRDLLRAEAEKAPLPTKGRS